VAPPAASEPSGPSLFTVQEQLGLKLESGTLFFRLRAIALAFRARLRGLR